MINPSNGSLSFKRMKNKSYSQFKEPEILSEISDPSPRGATSCASDRGIGSKLGYVPWGKKGQRAILTRFDDMYEPTRDDKFREYMREFSSAEEQTKINGYFSTMGEIVSQVEWHKRLE